MAGSSIQNRVQLGDSATDANNFELKTNYDGTLSLKRGAFGTLGSILTVSSSGLVTLNQEKQLLLVTAKPTTSGTFVDFTSADIPSWARRIKMHWNAVSTNGVSHYLVQVGTGGVPLTTTYVSNSQATEAGPSVATGSATTGYLALSGSAAIITSGHVELNLIAPNTWQAVLNLTRMNNSGLTSGCGIVTLSGILDIIRVTTMNGTDIFDAGSIALTIEG